MIWAVSSTPDPKAPAPKPSQAGKEPGVPGLDEGNELRDPIVEAIDPARGVLATLRMPEAVLLMGDWPYVVTFRSTEVHDVLDVWRFRLTR